jgi:hypothetical protein
MIHDEAFAKATVSEFNEITLGETPLKEHQLFEAHGRSGIVGKVSIIDFAGLFALLER